MDDELAGLLAAGERAAFHGRPASGVAGLRQAVELAQSADRTVEATAAVWMLGVCLGASGRYGGALTVLEPLAGFAAVESERATFVSLAASTIASLQRQLGRHAVGRTYDEAALHAAQDSAEARFDAELGLAADAVGLGESEVAAAQVEQAAQLNEDRHDWWRQRVRLDWVRAEVALLLDEPARALQHATAAVAKAETAGAPRHVAKGLLFVGVAHIELGDDAEAAVHLRRSASLAESLGAIPLVWPARAVLGTLLVGAAAGESARCLAAARAAVRAIAGDLPAELAAEWVARPEVADLLTG